MLFVSAFSACFLFVFLVLLFVIFFLSCLGRIFRFLMIFLKNFLTPSRTLNPFHSFFICLSILFHYSIRTDQVGVLTQLCISLPNTALRFGRRDDLRHSLSWITFRSDFLHAATVPFTIISNSNTRRVFR
uniref:Putative secreted peptide n=1 Tax=Anopheles braziliensis TaxID=58242 RepID=A0A2M3ZSQ8_9DIPT